LHLGMLFGAFVLCGIQRHSATRGFPKLHTSN
jgi:hypothetical protein